jgi:HAE1 family hydrophobic/amphiphilic exporter-1
MAHSRDLTPADATRTALVTGFVRNPVKTIVAMILIVLFGIIGAYRMPTQLTPEVQTPTLTVETIWPGASPQEVERQIVQEQELQLKSVEGVVKMTGECMDGMGKVIVEFAIGTNMQEALLKVNTRLQQVPNYPENAKSPVISTANSGDTPIGWFILKPRTPEPAEIAQLQTEHPDLKAALEPARTAGTAGLRRKRLRDLAEQNAVVKAWLPTEVDADLYRKFAEDVIEARFERVAGVANANIFGGREQEMQVIVDPQKLAARQLTVQDVRNALRGQNKDTSAGDLWEDKRRYVIRTLGQFRSPEQVLTAVLARREGKPVYVRDVAEVRLGHKKSNGLVKQFGTNCIAINAQRAVGANVLEVMQGLRKAMAELNAGVLTQKGLYLEQVYDETEYIYSAIHLVNESIVIGGCLTVLALLLFLRNGRSTLVISLAIPVSILGTFFVLSLLGRSLNVISLAGIAFAVGMLVDDAVVVLESIFQHLEMGKGRWQAAVEGTAEVWGAVLSGTLTKMAVFLPVLFVQEQAGQLFRDIALAISAGVGFSLIVSVTLIPVAAARMLRANTAPGKIGRFFAGALTPIDAAAGWFVNTTVGINRWLLRSWWLRFGLVCGFMALSFVGSYLLMPKVEYLPEGNQNLVFGILLPPPGYNVEQMTAIGERIEKKLQPYWDADPNDPATKQLKYPPIRDFFFVAMGRQLFMGMKCQDDLKAAALVPLVQEVAGDVPGTFAIGKQASLFEAGLTAGRTIDIEITGPELEKLIAVGGQIMGQVMSMDLGIAFPQPSLDLSSPELHVVPKWDHAADLGINALDLGYTVDALVDGAYAGDYYQDGVKIDLTIAGQAQFTKRTQDLEDLPIATPSGELVPLRAVASIKLASGPEQINHRQRQRAITIQVSPWPQVPLEYALERIQKEVVAPLKQGEILKTGLYQIQLAGTADKLRTTWESLRMNILLAVLVTYLLMAALFESWVYPFVVILSVPLGALGGFAALWLLNWFVLQPLDVLTMLGFVIMIGTVVSNPILIIEQALILIRSGQEVAPATLSALQSRIRPIFMTTTTTVFGLLPLVVFPGAGSELYRGLGAVLLGGLVVSTLVTLVVVPAVFTLMMEGSNRFIRGPVVAEEPISESAKVA